MFLQKSISHCICVLLFVCCFAEIRGQDKAESRKISLNVTVVDRKQGLIDNLTVSDFRIFSGKREQEIKSVAQKDEPVSIGILIDLSESMDVANPKKVSSLELIRNGLN